MADGRRMSTVRFYGSIEDRLEIYTELLFSVEATARMDTVRVDLSDKRVPVKSCGTQS